MRGGRGVIAGYELQDALAGLPFSERVRLIRKRGTRDYWPKHTLISGRSFARGIILKDLLQSPLANPGTVVLFAGVLGYGVLSGAPPELVLGRTTSQQSRGR